jgi:hypothetical protein
MKKVYLVICLYCFISCNEAVDKEHEAVDVKTDSVNRPKSKTPQLNLSILWDLSDRLDSVKNPSAPQQYEKDIEIIRQFCELFRQDMDSKGAYMAKEKIKVFFTPEPQDKKINEIAQKLKVDLSVFPTQGGNIQKKKVYDTITELFTQNAREIYRLTVLNNQGKKEWDGSDIWRFFKNEIDNCIEKDYRNVLIILTDGYIYHKDSRERLGNRTQYISSSLLKEFKGKADWKKMFESGNYGLIPATANLENLEVLVLEINALKDHRNEEDYIQAYLTRWFDEMGVKKFQPYVTGLPANTTKRIREFLN